MGVNRNVSLLFYFWLEVAVYHASTDLLPMYLIVLNIRTKYARNFYVSIIIYISLRISKLPRIFSNHISCSYSHFSFVSVRYTDPMSITVIPNIVNDMISVIVSRAEKFAAKSKLRSFTRRELCFCVRRG